MKHTVFATISVLLGTSTTVAQTVPDLGRIYRELKRHRAIQIDRLHGYTTRGRFPRNTDFPERRMPYFVDRYGTRCAVGELMWQSGHRAAVLGIARAHNQVRVMDVSNGPLVDWVLSSGLTQEECAHVQPSYEFYFTATEGERERVQTHLRKVEARLRAQSEQSLGRALRRYLDHEIAVGALTPNHKGALLAALKDKEPNVRIGAAHAIARLKIPARNELSACLDDDNREVRFWAAAALLETKPPPIGPQPHRGILKALQGALRDGSADQRMLAVSRLGILAYGAGMVPGERKTLREIRAALQPAVTDKSADVSFLARCMIALVGPRRNLQYQKLAYYNVAQRFLELQAGNDVHAAALLIDSKPLEHLLKEKPQLVNARNRFGETPLHLAAKSHWTQTRTLLKHKPDLAAQDVLGRLPLHVATSYVGGDPKIRDRIYSWTPLHYATHSGNHWMIERLIAEGADPNSKDKFGFTPLHLAVGCATPETDSVKLGGLNSYLTTRTLLKHGAERNVKDKKGRTPRQWAEELDNKDALDALSKQGG